MGVSSEKQVREFLRDCQRLPGRSRRSLPPPPSKPKKLLKIALLIVVGLIVIDWLTPDSTISQSYRSEIISKVIDPCYMRMIHHQGGIPGMTISKALEFFKRRRQQDVNKIVSSIQSVVIGEDRAARIRMYRVFQEQCVSAGIRGMNSIS